MLQFVIHQPGQRRLLLLVPIGLLRQGKAAQPVQVLPTGAQLQQLKSESLMFDAGKDMEP